MTVVVTNMTVKIRLKVIIAKKNNNKNNDDNSVIIKNHHKHESIANSDYQKIKNKQSGKTNIEIQVVSATKLTEVLK